MTKAQTKIIQRLAEGKDCGVYPCDKCPFPNARLNPNRCPKEMLVRKGAQRVLSLEEDLSDESVH